MGKEENRLDISQIVASPVLIGPTNLPMWTGVVRADKINQYLIADKGQREIFISLVSEYEKYIIEYREIDLKREPVLRVNQGVKENRFEKEQRRKAIEKKIHELSIQIKVFLNNPNNGMDMDLFWVFLCCDYEKILKENRAELSHMGEEAKKSLKKFKKRVDSRRVAVREIYNSEINEYRIISFPTEEQTRNNKTEQNPNKLVKLVSNIAGKEKMASSEGVKILEDIFESLYLADYFIIFPDISIAKIQYIIACKNYLLHKGYTSKEIEELGIEKIEEIVLKTYDIDGAECHSAIVVRTIVDGIKNIDFEKALLIASMRHLTALEHIGVEVKDVDTEALEQDEEKIRETSIMRSYTSEQVVDRIGKVEKLLRIILEQRMISPYEKVSIFINGEEQEISLKTIEGLMHNFCDGIYITKHLIETYKYKAFMDEQEMSTWSDDLLKRMELKDRDIILLSLINLNNFKRLYELGLVNKDSIIMLLSINENGSLKEALTSGEILEAHEERVNKILKNGSELLPFLFSEGLIDFNDLKSFYDLRIIKIDDLEKIEDGKTEAEQVEFRNALGSKVSYKEVFTAYKDYIEHKLRYENALKTNDPDIDIYKDTMEIKRKEKESLLMFFKKYKFDDLSVDKKNEIVTEIFMECLDLKSEIVTELFRDMYKDGIMNLENISDFDKDTDFEFSVTNYIFARGEFNLNDNDKLRGSLSPEVLQNLIQSILDNPEISMSQKFSLIMNVYCSGENADLESINKFWSSMTEVGDVILTEEQKNIIRNRKKRKTEPKDERKTGSTEWIYPKETKWLFFGALDKEAEMKIYANGYVEMYSKKLGVRIIERYFEGDFFEREAYGYATFIVKDNVYRDNLDRILGQKAYKVKNGTQEDVVVEEVIVREILSELVPKDDRIRHYTKGANKNWMRQIIRYFDIDLETDLDLVQDTRYSREELEKIRNVIKLYENATVER